MHPGAHPQGSSEHRTHETQNYAVSLGFFPLAVATQIKKTINIKHPQGGIHGK
jgi:hypothetical protein